jgi:hypothetical protein
MKAGLWEQRVTKQIVDGKDMTAQMAGAQAVMQQALAGMSPAQRKQMEAMMAKQGGMQKGQGLVFTPDGFRICVSPEMAARDKPTFPGDHKCEPTNVSRSGNRMTFEVNCNAQNGTANGKGEAIFLGDTINVKGDMVVTDARGKHTIHMEQTSTYVGPDCQGTKPADQIAASMNASRKK